MCGKNNGDCLLIKAGGGKSLNWKGICRDISGLFPETPIVLVHGANAARDDLASRLGVSIRTVESPSGVASVYTDERALDVFLMAYPGLINTRVVALLHGFGVNAVGLSGLDGRLWQARPKKEILVRTNGKVKMLKGNLTGTVERVDASLVRLLLEHGYLPVVSPPALSFENEAVNADSDWAVGLLAEALNVKRLVFLFEAPGLLENHEDEATLISEVERHRVREMSRFAAGRMKKKMLGAGRAIEGGVEVVVLADGRVEHPVLAALEGKGTVIR